MGRGADCLPGPRGAPDHDPLGNRTHRTQRPRCGYRRRGACPRCAGARRALSFAGLDRDHGPDRRGGGFRRRDPFPGGRRPQRRGTSGLRPCRDRGAGHSFARCRTCPRVPEGQRAGGARVGPSRAERLHRSLFAGRASLRHVGDHDGHLYRTRHDPPAAGQVHGVHHRVLQGAQAGRFQRRAHCRTGRRPALRRRLPGVLLGLRPPDRRTGAGRQLRRHPPQLRQYGAVHRGHGGHGQHGLPLRKRHGHGRGVARLPVGHAGNGQCRSRIGLQDGYARAGVRGLHGAAGDGGGVSEFHPFVGVRYPSGVPTANIEAFYRAVADFNGRKR